MYKVMKDYKIVGVVEEWSATDKRFNPDLRIEQDNEHQISDFVQCDSEYLLRQDPRAIEYKQNQVREIRNAYLAEYVDPVVSNPLRWADMTEEEKQRYADYRRYLLDYTTQENWWENTPKTLEQWSE